jgi:hypothetical protein
MGVSGQHYAPAALYSRESTPGTHWIGGWLGLRTGPNTEARGNILYLCRVSKPGRPVCSQTLYWLSYTGSDDIIRQYLTLKMFSNLKYIKVADHSERAVGDKYHLRFFPNTDISGSNTAWGTHANMSVVFYVMLCSVWMHWTSFPSKTKPSCVYIRLLFETGSLFTVLLPGTGYTSISSTWQVWYKSKLSPLWQIFHKK